VGLVSYHVYQTKQAGGDKSTFRFLFIAKRRRPIDPPFVYPYLCHALLYPTATTTGSGPGHHSDAE